MRLLFLTLLLILSCEKKQEIVSEKSTNQAEQQTPIVPLNDQLYWILDSDSLTKTRNPEFHVINLQEDSVISVLNTKFEHTKLKKVKKSNDTLFVAIENPQYFSNQMGSMGAGNYMANVILNLTAVEGINFVDMNFTEGSHASPGVYSGKDFWSYKEKP